MSDGTDGTIHIATEGGVAADHPPEETFAAFVDPTTADDFSTIRMPLIPIACWRLEDVRFEFDSSFVLREAKTELTHLAALRTQHPRSPVSIFGHADPTGTDDYNKVLSGRRSTAVYGLLTRNTDLWEELFSTPFGGDNWGTKSIQRMLDDLLFSPGPFTGAMNKETREAVKRFQRANGLSVDGDPGPNTRKKLFAAYMDHICTDINGKPFKLEKTDFLARGADSGGKGDFQGCSEFNPVLMFSKDENDRFEASSDKTERNFENTPNRRVMLLMFREGSSVTPDIWPCPRVKEGIADCKKRFFSDADVRRSFQATRREFEKTKDTFACRFYQRISERSPCEAPGRFPNFIQVVDEIGLPVKNSAVKLTLSDGSESILSTDDDGKVRPDLPPGTRFTIELADIHEFNPGDSTLTSSGQHFVSGGRGPR